MRASRKPYTASRRSVPIAPRRPETPEGRRARRTIDQEVRPMRKVILCIAMLARARGAPHRGSPWPLRGPGAVLLASVLLPRSLRVRLSRWLRLCLPGSVRKLREDGAVHLRLSRAVRLRHVDLFPPSLPRETGRVLDL